jgi:hypothetical protein
MALFTKKLNRQTDASPLGKTVAAIRELVQGSQVANPSVARIALSTENLRDNDVTTLASAVDGLSTGLEALAAELGIKDMTAAQIDAATAAGIIAGDVKGFMSRKIEPITVGSESVGVVSSGLISGDDAIGERVLGMESYDERENRDAAIYAIAYNMQASRQDEFGETWFPTITVTPDNVGFAITVRLIQVQDDAQRDISGAVTNFNRKNVIRALADPTILKNEQTRMIPVYRPEAAKNFVDPTLVAPSAYDLEGETITTAPLACGVRMGLIELSQTDTLLKAGVMDISDTIDPAIVLSNLYVKVGDDVLRIKTNGLPLSQFNYAPQNNYRIMQLNFETNSVLLNAKTKSADGADLVTLKSIVDQDYIVRLNVVANGNVNIDTAESAVYGNEVSVYSVTDATGNLLSLKTGAGKAVADLFADAKIFGFDVQAYRTNANRRQRGQLINTTYYTQMYNVPLRAPVTAMHPVNADSQVDSSDLNSLITVTRIRTSNQAVGALVAAAQTLSEFADARDSAGVWPDVLGVGRFFVIPTFFSETIDMTKVVDSLKSSERASDMQEALVAKVRDFVFRMYRDSQYKAAADALYGGVAPTPTVIIGTDPVLARYLTVTGDLRTVGGNFEVRVVSTLDYRVSGKIFISFGVFDENRNTQPNPLNFGNMAWAPEVTVSLPISRTGQISKETAVQPRFLHVVNCPVMTVLEVINVPDVTNKVALFVKQ